MSGKKRGEPRTGNGRDSGRKPHASELRIRSAEEQGPNVHPDNRYRGSQPKGWGIAKVIDIITRKER